MQNYNGSFNSPALNVTHLPSGKHWRSWMAGIVRSFCKWSEKTGLTSVPGLVDTPRLDRGWIIANHKLVSFHAAFLTSLLSISPHVASNFDVIRQMFFSLEVVISSLMWYVAWHSNIAIHEMGHYLTAVKTNNLRPELAGPAEEKLKQGLLGRWLWYLEMFVRSRTVPSRE